MEELMMEFRRPEGISFDWTSLANILAGPTFAQLQNIHIEADVVPNGVHAICLQEDAWQTAERSIRHGAVSMFDRRGILHFTLFEYKRFTVRCNPKYSPKGSSRVMVIL